MGEILYDAILTKMNERNLGKQWRSLSGSVKNMMGLPCYAFSVYVCMYLYIHICVYRYTCVYIYIYIECPSPAGVPRWRQSLTRETLALDYVAPNMAQTSGASGGDGCGAGCDCERDEEDAASAAPLALLH